MRLDPDDSATVEAAFEAGVTVFDTARAYEGNEELSPACSATQRERGS